MWVWMRAKVVFIVEQRVVQRASGWRRGAWVGWAERRGMVVRNRGRIVVFILRETFFDGSGD